MLRRYILPSKLQVRAFSVAGHCQTEWSGRKPSEHVTNSDDALSVHADASKAGREDRAQGDGGGQAQATTEKDQRKSSERAKKEFPEAPSGPVLGMNDERGSKGQ
ncbi:MAG: hypothetical protein M1815_002737 [Lichina confinis]|nr:MAG: hypothetical protein M1815_002737 [Lichina confinis]